MPRISFTLHHFFILLKGKKDNGQAVKAADSDNAAEYYLSNIGGGDFFLHVVKVLISHIELLQSSG